MREVFGFWLRACICMKQNIIIMIICMKSEKRGERNRERLALLAASLSPYKQRQTRQGCPLVYSGVYCFGLSSLLQCKFLLERYVYVCQDTASERASE